MSPRKLGWGEGSGMPDPSPLAPASSPMAAGSSATPLSGAVPRNAPQGFFPRVTLGDVAKVRSGFAFKSEHMGDHGCPIVKIRNISPPTVDIVNCEKVPESVIESIPDSDRFLLRSGDILIAMTGATVGKIGKFPETSDAFYLNQRVGKVYLLENHAADYAYIYHVLSQNSYSDLIFAAAEGSAQANISGGQIERIEIPLPPISVQKSIAHILGTLDDKIELNRRINQTLEEMAQALFKSWFVDFDPVRAKAAVYAAANSDPTDPTVGIGHARSLRLGEQAELAAMRVISGKTDDELVKFRQEQPDAYAELARTASLFPSRLTESDLGQIPEGWELAKLNQVCSYLARGIGPSYCEPGEGAVRVLNQKCIRDGKVDITPSRLHDSTKRSIQGRELHALDILVNSTGQGTLGRTAQIGESDSVTVVDSHVTVLRPDASKISKLYLGINIRLREQEIESMAEGSTGQTELSRIRLGELNVLVPELELLRTFDTSIEPVFQQKMEMEKECSRLAECRDSLLPKLLSGELEIPDELLAEAAP